MPCTISDLYSDMLHQNLTVILSALYEFEILDVKTIFEAELQTSSKLIAVLSIFLILLINIPLLNNIFQKENKTFINKLIATDCILCISNCITLVNMVAGKQRNSIICYISPPFAYFINISKRLLTIGIVLYRYVFVLKNSRVETGEKRRLFCSRLAGIIFLMSLLSTCLCVLYREQNLFFLGNYKNWISIVIEIMRETMAGPSFKCRQQRKILLCFMLSVVFWCIRV